MRWLVVALLALALPAAVHAQSCTVGSGVGNLGGSCSIDNAFSIQIRQTVRLVAASTSITLPPPQDADFAAGHQTAPGHQLQVRGNSGWQLSISSPQGTFSASGGAWPNKPRSDLAWGAAVDGPFQPMTATPSAIATGGPTGGTTVNVYYRITWAWATDRPGTYSLPITLTVSSP